jgi:hypothetical protein
MIGLLITLLFLLIVFGVLFYVISLLPLPHPFGVIAQLLVGLILLLIVLGMVLGGIPHYRLALP